MQQFVTPINSPLDRGEMPSAFLFEMRNCTEFMNYYKETGHVVPQRII